MTPYMWSLTASLDLSLNDLERPQSRSQILRGRGSVWYTYIFEKRI